MKFICMELIHINILVLFCIIFILAYIKICFPFWNIQPVYHSYDFWKLMVKEPYFVYKNKPIITKFCDFENVQTFLYSELTPEKQSEMENLVQCYYISSENVLNIITKENLRSYFTGYNEPVYVSFYNEKNINNSFLPIGFISSRPMDIYLDNMEYKTYFVDYLSINREHLDKKISRKLLQTHEFNSRVLNPNIKCSLLKKEIELYSGVVPLVEYTTSLYYLRNISLPSLPKHCLVSRIYKQDLNFLSDFFSKIREHNDNYKIRIIPDLGSLQTLIKNELLYVYVLKKGLEFLGIYFIKDEKTQYDNMNDAETLHFVASVNNCSSEKMFILGFFHVMKSIQKYKKYYSLLLFDNVGNNELILRTWRKKYTPIIENKAAYYTFNLIHPGSPISYQKSFILL